MSSHDWANSMNSISKTFLETSFPNEYKVFIDICEKDEEDFDQIAHYLSYEPAEVSEEVNTAFNNLNFAFYKKHGLNLSMRRIDSDVDTAPDIEDGAYFVLEEDMYIVRPEVETLNKLGADIKNESYVSWG